MRESVKEINVPSSSYQYKKKKNGAIYIFFISVERWRISTDWEKNRSVFWELEEKEGDGRKKRSHRRFTQKARKVFWSFLYAIHWYKKRYRYNDQVFTVFFIFFVKFEHQFTYTIIWILDVWHSFFVSIIQTLRYMFYKVLICYDILKLYKKIRNNYNYPVLRNTRLIQHD